MVIAHRGNDNHKYKENSFLSINNSLNKEYIDGAEFDIRITKDKQFVLNHGFISEGKIIKYTNYKDLNLDKLTNVLKKINNKKLLLIEIKDNEDIIIDLLYKIIKPFNKLNIYIMSFHKDLIIKFKKKYPKIKLGIIAFNLNDNFDIFDFVCIYYPYYKKINKDIFLWTVNNKEQIKKFINMNVNIITDKPYLAK